MDEIIKYYYSNGDNDIDELEILFGIINIKDKIKNNYICKDGKIFENLNYFEIHKKKCLFDTTINFNNFNRCISVFKKKKFSINTEYYLNIFIKKVRIRIKTLENIKGFCNSNILPEDNIEFIKKIKKYDKTHKINSSYTNNEYSFKMNYKTEEYLNEDEIKELKENFNHSRKKFRFIKRYSLSYNGLPFNLDCSIIKKSKNFNRNETFKNIKQTNIFNNISNYEIEMEFLKKNKLNELFNNVDELIKTIKNNIKLVFCTLSNSNYPLNLIENINVLNSYHNLNKNNSLFKNIYKRKGCINNYNNFFGPSSITIQRDNLNSEIQNNIFEYYCVTDKADGERKFLFISELTIKKFKNAIFLIDMNLNIQFTGLSCKDDNFVNTIIDGEHILYIKEKYINTFYAFDIYFINKENIYKKIFYDNTKNNRYGYLNHFFDNIKKNIKKNKINDLNIELKHFEFISEKKDIYKCCDNIFNNFNKSGAKINYKTDGLIFTPTNKNVIKMKNVTYKWKPSEENTIDFLIEKKKTIANNFITTINNGEEYNILNLYIGSNHGDYKKAFLNNERLKNYNKTLFKPDEYNDLNNAHICKIKLEMINGVKGMYTEKNEKDERYYIENDTIVEFRYDSENKNWIPIKLRNDKTLQYKLFKSNFGNNFITANNNWKSINEPISEDVLRGNIKLDKSSDLNDIIDMKKNYYFKGRVNNRFETVNLKKFHNQIKFELIKYCKKKIDNLNKNNDNQFKPKTLIDMTCGKGGDLMKWVNNDFKFIVGFDYAYKNIYNNEDGIYKRCYDLKQKRQNLPYMVFEQANSSNNIKNGKAFEDVDFKENNMGNDIVKCVFGEKYKNYNFLKNFQNKASSGFDVVSNQFSIHYFFEDRKKLTGLIQNVAECCRLNGYFIGTCFDGKEIFNLMKDKKKFKLNSEKKKKNKIFEIEKLYDKGEFIDDETSLGLKIQVYMESIGKAHYEYLVNFNYFEKIMNYYGFILDNNFKINEKKLNGSDSFETLAKIFKKKYKLTENDKQISFMNKYFVFKKKRKSLIIPAEVTKKILRGVIFDNELLIIKENGYELNLFSKKKSKRYIKDNNFLGIPKIFKRNSGNILQKFKRILKTNYIKILNIDNDLFKNNFKLTNDFYKNEVKIDEFLVINFKKNFIVKKNININNIENILLKNKNIIYYGIISSFENENYYPYLIFKKGNNEINNDDDDDTINPSLIVNEYTYKKSPKQAVTFKVFDDCNILGGTKQRALIPFLSRINNNTISYVGPTIGFAQIALAKSLKILNNKKNNEKILKLYFNDTNLKEKHLKITKHLCKIYDKIIITMFTKNIKKFKKIFDECISSTPNFSVNYDNRKKSLSEIHEYVLKTDPDSYVVPFGLRFPGFVNVLSNQIINAIEKNTKLGKNFRQQKIRIWLVIGSGAILNALYKVFPKAEFVGLQVGATVWDDIIDKKRTTIKIYSDVIKLNNDFIDDISNKDFNDLPYDSVKNYDAKIWPIFKKFYDKMDKKKKIENYIWNVGCLKTFEDIMNKKKIITKNKLKIFKTNEIITIQ